MIPVDRWPGPEAFRRKDLDFKRLDVPPARSPAWAVVTLPLFALLRERPRTIDEVVAWGREQGHTGALTRHLLAWLSFRDLVHHDADSRTWCVGRDPPHGPPR